MMMDRQTSAGFDNSVNGSSIGSPLGPQQLAASYRFSAKCPKCNIDFPKPPKNWDCSKCSTKTWQPDDAVEVCQVCDVTVAKFTRHHCRCCGLITCTNCTCHQIIMPEWGPEKQRVCKRCAVPDAPPVLTGFLQKLSQKSSFFGEKLQTRFFQLRGTILLYGKERGGVMNGQVDIANCKVMDVAIHPHSFCLIGPRLQRGYVLSAESAEKKAEWIAAIQKQVQLQQASNNSSSGAYNSGGLSGGRDDDEDAATEAVLFDQDGGGATGEQSVSMGDFDVLTVLGLGSFGRVMKVKHRRTGNIYAMKVLDKHQIITNKMVTHTQAEKTILTEVNNPFIVKLHYAFQTKKHLVLVLDFLCGGELFFHLQRSKRFTESRAKFYAAQIGLALEHIHAMKIIYRDLKPENLVLDRQGNCVLTDFGLAKREVKDMTHTFCGTPEYMAPELIQKKGHTYAVDWWSLGIFLYEMVHGLPPFYTQNVTEMYDLILNRPLTFPTHFSGELKSLLTRLLERDPLKRMQSGEEFRRHPFFRDISWDKLLAKELKPEFVPDIGNNDLKYFDKQFTQESTKVAQLDLPNDPLDPASKKFEGFEYTQGPGASSGASPTGTTRRSGGTSASPTRRGASASPTHQHQSPTEASGPRKKLTAAEIRDDLI
jgi:serum/glucocorticoid-regulated kinase 2